MQSTESRVFVASRDVGVSGNPARQARKILQALFVALPVIAGLDKFSTILVDWPIYLAPAVRDVLPIGAREFMYIVGVVEIAAGAVVAMSPRVGGYLVAAWMFAIAINLVMHTNGYYDIAARDVGLGLAALALARLSEGWRAQERPGATQPA